MKRYEIDEKLLCELYLEGKTNIVKLKKIFKVSQYRITEVLNKNGISVRPRSYLGYREPKPFKPKRRVTKINQEYILSMIGEKSNFLTIENWNTENHSWNCVCDCERKTLIRNCDFLSGKAKSCSFCARANSNISSEDRQIQYEKREKPSQSQGKIVKWRMAVLNRDNFQCQCCLKRGGNLAAHHIFAWHSHRKLRFSIENGVTLCERCHKNFHRIFGMKLATAKKFRKFIEYRILFLIHKWYRSLLMI